MENSTNTNHSNVIKNTSYALIKGACTILSDIVNTGITNPDNAKRFNACAENLWTACSVTKSMEHALESDSDLLQQIEPHIWLRDALDGITNQEIAKLNKCKANAKDNVESLQANGRQTLAKVLNYSTAELDNMFRKALSTPSISISGIYEAANKCAKVGYINETISVDVPKNNLMPGEIEPLSQSTLENASADALKSYRRQSHDTKSIYNHLLILNECNLENRLKVPAIDTPLFSTTEKAKNNPKKLDYLPYEMSRVYKPILSKIRLTMDIPQDATRAIDIIDVEIQRVDTQLEKLASFSNTKTESAISNAEAKSNESIPVMQCDSASLSNSIETFATLLPKNTYDSVIDTLEKLDKLASHAANLNTQLNDVDNILGNVPEYTDTEFNDAVDTYQKKYDIDLGF